MYVSSRPILLPTGPITRHLVDIPISREIQGRLLSFSTPFKCSSSGDWLGLGQGRAWTREEPYKLARLRLDIPNTADADWDIDIKKSVARAPNCIAFRLRYLAEYVRDQGRQVFAHRGSYGRRVPTPDLQRAWRVVQRLHCAKCVYDLLIATPANSS